MRGLARLLLIVLVGIGALAPIPVAASPAGAATGGGRPTAIDWVPCAEDSTAECGTLRVPVDWAQPYGQTVDLAVARRRATDPARRIGSLLVNPGGPGGSGVDIVLFGSWFFSPELTRHFDLVGFDPRGVGRSHPVMCSFELLAQAPAPELTSQADFDRLVAYNNRLGADCRQRTGPLFDHVDTLSVVRDLNAIRAAVGDRQLSFYGTSYGTLLGQQYAELFPRRVRALALDSNMDHSLDTRAFLASEAAAAQDSFDEFVQGCAADPRCVLHGRDVRALWASLMARADRGELPDPYDPARRLTSAALSQIAFGALYAPDWFGLAEFLLTVEGARTAPARYGGPAFGRAASAPAAFAGPAVAPTTRAAAGPTGAGDPLPEAVPHAFPAVFCADWRLPIRDYPQYARFAAESAAVAPDLRSSPLALAATASCLGWPSRVANPQHRLAVRGAGPLLLLNARHDPATAYAWAVNTARQLGGNAVLLTYDGWGHGAYGRGACVTDAVDRYLVSLALPAPGTRCPAVWPEPSGVRAALRPVPVGPSPLVPGWRHTR